MAAIMTCPECKSKLKEAGDEMKACQGEYCVYVNLWNSKHEAGERRVIECLVCGFIALVSKWPLI